MSPDGIAGDTEIPETTRARLDTGVAAPRRDHAGVDRGRRRHVVGGGGVARRAGGIRRAAGRSVAAVHADDARLRARRRDHGPALRPGRNPGGRSRSARSRSAWVMSAPRSAGSLVAFALAQALIGFGSSATFGPLMADISHLVRAPPRHRRDAVLGRQLSSPARCGRRSCTFRSPIDGWRATHAGIGLVLRRGDAAAAVIALRGGRPPQSPARALRRAAARRRRSVCRRARCRRCCAGVGLLLRGDVDAAGPYRRLLRRSRLWRRARRRHAVR